jgi:hypothetical protein
LVTASFLVGDAILYDPPEDTFEKSLLGVLFAGAHDGVGF